MNFISAATPNDYMTMASISSLLSDKANRLSEKANLLEWIGRLRQGGNHSQADIQERNLIRIERDIADIERQIANASR